MYGMVKDEGKMAMLLGRNASLEGEVKDVEGMHSPQFAHAHKTQHVTTTLVGTLNILEHSFCLCIFICHYHSLVQSLLLSHLLCQMRYINSANKR